MATGVTEPEADRGPQAGSPLGWWMRPARRLNFSGIPRYYSGSHNPARLRCRTLRKAFGFP